MEIRKNLSPPTTKQDKQIQHFTHVFVDYSRLYWSLSFFILAANNTSNNELYFGLYYCNKRWIKI